jgi:serine/threonine protein kinase
MKLDAAVPFGSYEIVAPLGAGGMGEVYRGRDTRLRREVTIKVLPQDLADDPERVTRLTREARLLAALSHPNIAAIYGVATMVEARNAATPPLVVLDCS